MATRIYFPSSGSPLLASLGYSSGWNRTSAAVRYPAVTTKLDTAVAQQASLLSTATIPEFHAGVQYQLPNLAAQTITGNIKGQIRTYTNSVNFHGTVAIAMRIVSADGSVSRGDLIGPTPAASTGGAVPPELATGAVSSPNRKFMDSSNNASIILNSVTAVAGDVLVIELGVRDNTTSTTQQGFLKVGDPIAAGDLPEDETTTSDMAAWVEFSNTISFAAFVPLMSGWGNNSWDLGQFLKRKKSRVSFLLKRRDSF